MGCRKILKIGSTNACRTNVVSNIYKASKEPPAGWCYSQEAPSTASICLLPCSVPAPSQGIAISTWSVIPGHTGEASFLPPPPAQILPGRSICLGSHPT